MGKNKLEKFAENATFSHVVQPDLIDARHNDHPIKGNWRSSIFKNLHPIVLELGCGYGEYTVELGRKHPQKNFIGVDIKGARIWRGAKTVQQEQLSNIAFLRTRIEFICRFFAPDEVDEIWITFPDPQPKTRSAKNRLTHSSFLSRYQQFLKHNAIVHLKTDNLFLHRYTRLVLEHNGLEILYSTENLYASPLNDEALTIKTRYETWFESQGFNITYLKFRLPNDRDLSEPDYDNNELLRISLLDSTTNTIR
ncbi:MAG TPA: tRNA (guanosine(46)-N7)-methyltransferase TrmB [Salinivirgaceae bacterium]|nr:tRNA (guanosine(46)-N7)-methyltransferase TrmB [Salinivirgaceae bacterium]